MHSVQERIKRCEHKLSQLNIPPGRKRTVISPYRINPLGAHVDHQGGAVLAQPIDQCTILSFATETLPAERSSDACIEIHSMQPQWPEPLLWSQTRQHSEQSDNWKRYLLAAIAVFNQQYPISNSITGVVDGTLIGAGLSSSASVILAYLSMLAHAENLELDAREQVELCRQVENGHLGLNNGVQDQMSIVFGKAAALAQLDVDKVEAHYAESPASVSETGWILLFSGYSRELINSGFNTRVQECQEAAALLQAGAKRLGDVKQSSTQPQALTQAITELPDPYNKRARHYFEETARVAQGAEQWRAGNWAAFGQLMNESCHSSINYYQSGSEALVTAHQIALETAGVYGSRFGGGGYGGCLIMLVENALEQTIKQQMLSRYLQQFPDREGIASIHTATASDGLRILS